MVKTINGRGLSLETRINIIIAQFLILLPALLISSCGGEPVKKVQALQLRDKQLNCTQAALEINEAEFYRSMAEKSKNPNVKSLLMPLGYVSTYMNAEEAADTANSRVDYLNRIYEIMDCGKSIETAGMAVPRLEHIDKTEEYRFLDYSRHPYKTRYTYE